MVWNIDVKKIKVRALRKDILVSDMDMGEVTLSSGIIINSDDGKAHGVKPRWAKIYRLGKDQTDFQEGQWILIEHGRWTRKVKIDDGTGIKEIQKIDPKAVLLVSDDPPSSEDILVKDSI